MEEDDTLEASYSPGEHPLIKQLNIIFSSIISPPPFPSSPPPSFPLFHLPLHPPPTPPLLHHLPLSSISPSILPHFSPLSSISPIIPILSPPPPSSNPPFPFPPQGIDYDDKEALEELRTRQYKVWCLSKKNLTMKHLNKKVFFFNIFFIYKNFFFCFEKYVIFLFMKKCFSNVYRKIVFF